MADHQELMKKLAWVPSLTLVLWLAGLFSGFGGGLHTGYPHAFRGEPCSEDTLMELTGQERALTALASRAKRACAEPTPGNATMFCFCLAKPGTWEPQVLSKLHALGQGIFACEEAAVYGNSSGIIGEGFEIRVIDANMDIACKGNKCNKFVQMGQEVKGLREVFQAVWTRVLSDGQFQRCQWTVKVDADSVFLPDRLRVRLRQYSEPAQGMYLNSCPSLHLFGSIQVFSRKAVLAWGAGRHRCRSEGVVWLQEDRFIDSCLKDVLNVTQVNEHNLLFEPICFWFPGQETKKATPAMCNRSGTVVFHPMKSVEGHLECLDIALKKEEKAFAPRAGETYTIQNANFGTYLAADSNSSKGRLSLGIGRDKVAAHWRIEEVAPGMFGISNVRASGEHLGVKDNKISDGADMTLIMRQDDVSAQWRIAEVSPDVHTIENVRAIGEYLSVQAQLGLRGRRAVLSSDPGWKARWFIVPVGRSGPPETSEDTDAS